MKPLLCLLFSGATLLGAPVILNPSFEESPGILWPHITADYTNGPRGWSMEGGNGAGVNPVLIHFNPLNLIPHRDLGPRPFADNGLTPHGTNVAVYWTRGRMFQEVSGFEAGKAYRLHFHYNARSLYARPILEVKLGGLSIFGPTEPLSPVEGTDQYTQPYRRGVSREFEAQASGSYLLELLNQCPAGDDAALLLDHLSFEELGTMRMLSARRLENDPARVRVTFSEPLLAASASDTSQYAVQPHLDIFEATLEPSGLEVTLRTTPLYDDREVYLLSAPGIQDAAGKRMREAHASRVIQIPPPDPPRLILVPTEYGLEISWPVEAVGFQLEYAEQLLSPIPWTPIQGFPQQFGDRWIYLETLEAPQIFYRLRR